MSVGVDVISITTVGGSGSGNSNHRNGILRDIEVVPPSASTIQTVSILNPYGTTVWSDTLAGTDHIHVNMAWRGIYTVQLSGANSNGANTVRLWIETGR